MGMMNKLERVHGYTIMIQKDGWGARRARHGYLQKQYKTVKRLKVLSVEAVQIINAVIHDGSEK